ncbi:ABC transporter ATP-binding protein [Synechococcus sp. M16CYN]|uniref:ABC transporter ATP-binding protein n=1 Tax=Synechococcus sp. M16CYN TaxID=3103139 RepID=UPI003243A881
MELDHRVSSLERTLGLVELRGLWHRYGKPSDDWILRGIDLQIKKGELVGLLGPSGCGKTTLLRLIAGFERPSRGSIHLRHRTVAGPNYWLPPERRGVGVVFQDYALFPHLTAWQNVCFGLRPGQDRSRAIWLLDLLELQELKERYPHQLSGGQRQRLALARALTPAPQVVLLDEPFSNLDVEVSLLLRSELASLLQICETSGLLVTHDPEEALAICDRVAVMRDGVLHQFTTPQDLVGNPATPFVGRFVLQGNLLPVWPGEDGLLHCCLGSLVSPSGLSLEPWRKDASLLVDPTAISLQPQPDAEACVVGREFYGHGWQFRVRINHQQLRVTQPLEHDYNQGMRCRLGFRKSASAILFPQRLRLNATDPYGS